MAMTPGRNWILTNGTMKYIICDYGDNIPSNDANGNSWIDLAYDDSSWETLTLPMGSADNGFVNQNYTIEGIRKTFFLRMTIDDFDQFDKIYYPEWFDTDYNFKIMASNEAQVFLNGKLIAQIDGKETSWKEFTIPSGCIVPGKNQLSILYSVIDNPSYLNIGMSLYGPYTYTDSQGITYEMTDDSWDPDYCTYTVTGHTIQM